MENQRKYGLIGKKLSHSFSQKYFTEKFNNQSVNSIYFNYELNNISEVRNLLRDPEIEGLNVTIPYKVSIIPFLDELDGLAEEIGAVNTIKIKDGKAKGYNTDVYGFSQMIKPFFESQHERAMILGTGGASKAVAYALEKLGVDVIYISREPQGEFEFGYDEINENMVKFHGIIVNTTPIGTFPNIDECPNFPFEFLTPKHLVVDLIYNPSETLFLKRSKENGAVVINGKTMLEQQAEEAWRIWNE
ncbi:MAG: shikimate dehydrogenase [Crocinitomicaceae bacterium]